MKPRASGVSRTQRPNNFQREGPNWVLIAGGALLSTLSIRLGYKLRQATDKKQEDANSSYKGNGKSPERGKSIGPRMNSSMYTYMQDDESFIPGIDGITDVKHPHNGQMITEPEGSLSLVTVPTREYSRDNGIWASSPDRLELPPKPFHHSNCSDSPCVSESGSDIFSKREVIQKLRQQLKRRDEMILEMQDQIVELQNSLNSQLEHSTHLQAQVDAANRDLFDSQREIQRLRKAIADHCVGHVGSQERVPAAPVWPSELRNGHANGYMDGGNHLDSLEKEREMDKTEMFKKEIRELKEVIEGKEYLLQSYKEQKTELSFKVKELQQRIDSQLPNIL